MSELLTMQDLANGHLDVKALGEAANGDENTIVTTRTGNTYPSAERAINIMFQNGGLPAKPFTTKAKMETEGASLTDGSYALVSDDTPDQNGIYIKEAGSWVKSKYDPMIVAKNDLSNKVTLREVDIGTLDSELLRGYAVTPVSHPTLVTTYNPDYTDSRAIIRFDVAGIDKVVVKNSRHVFSKSDNWAWTFVNENMDKRLSSAETGGNIELTVPKGAKYLVRNAILSGLYNPVATVTALKTGGYPLPVEIIQGRAVLPLGSNSVLSNGYDSGREAIRIDVSHHKQVEVINAHAMDTGSNWNWVFEGSINNARLQDTELNGGGVLRVPDGARYLVRTSLIDGEEDRGVEVTGLYFGAHSTLTKQDVKSELSDALGYELVSTETILGTAISDKDIIIQVFFKDRAYSILDVSGYKKVIIKDAKEITDLGPNGDDNWHWLVYADDMSTVLYKSDFVGSGEIILPSGAKYLARNALLHGNSDFEVPVIGYNKKGSVSLETDELLDLRNKQQEHELRINNLSLTANALRDEIDSKGNTYITIDGAGNELLTSERRLGYIIMSGSSVNTNTSDSKLLASGSYRSYIVVDVEGVDKLKQVNGTGRDSDLNWAFTSNMRDRMELSNNKTGTGDVLVPTGAKYAVRTFELPSGYNFKESADFEVWAVKNHQTKAEYEDYLKSFKIKARQLIKDSGLLVYKISDFDGATSHDKINAILKLIKTTNNGGIIDLEYGTHLVNSAIILPSNTWLYLNDATLKLADGVFDNIIRNDGIVPSDDPFAVATELNQNENIRVFGNNPFYSAIEGPDYPYRAPAPVNPNGDVNWTGDPFGWRTIGILFANVKNYDIHDFNMSKTTAWAMSNEHGCENMRIHDLWFDTRVANGDGVHFVIGCKNAHVYNINGFTGDDAVAITATKNFLTQHPIYERKQYYYPMAVGGWDDRGHGVDVTDFVIHDIAGSGFHQGVRLLCSGGSKLRNISVNDVFETAPYGWRSSTVIMGTGYGTNAEWGDISNNTINNVDTFGSSNAVRLNAKISDTYINNIKQHNASNNIVRTDEAELSEVTITNDKYV